MKVGIVGGGVAGLVAAIELEKAGADITVFERSDTVGGRLKTERVTDIPLDFGFQVLPSAYPMTRRYLNLEALDPVRFAPGAACLSPGQTRPEIIGDPLRDRHFLRSAVFPGVGGYGDALKLLQWVRELKSLSVDTLFERPETRTMECILKRGFSDAMVQRFLGPFLAGIVLETDLKTSSRMAELALKMFGEGQAVVPKNGMAAIPQQLASKLKGTTFHTTTLATEWDRKSIATATGERWQFDAVICAVPNAARTGSWKSVRNFTLETDHKGFGLPILGLFPLLPGRSNHVNNLHFLHDLSPKTGTRRVNVSVLHPAGSMEESLEAVRNALESVGIHPGECIHQADVTEALPDISSMTMRPGFSSDDDVVCASDSTCNTSLQGAMESGRAAAAEVLRRHESERN